MITLSPTSVTLYVGATTTLTATVVPSGSTVSWSSSNTSVATVSSSGLVTAKAAGTATITASATGAVSKTCTVTVRSGGVVIAPVTTGQDGQTVGNTIALKATTTPSGGTVTWSSEDTSVATVSSSGIVTIKSLGQTNITATYGSYKSTYTVYGILSDGLFTLRNRGSYLYAEIYGTSVLQTEEDVHQTDGIDDSKKQMWHFQYAGSGRYLIRTRINPTMALAPASGDTGKVGTVYVGETTNAPNLAYWTITGSGNYYTVKNISTGKVLSVVTGTYSECNKTQLLLEEDEGSTEQRWGRFAVTGDNGGIYLVRRTYPTVDMPNPTTCTLDIGSYTQYVASYYSPTDFSQNFTWTSGNTSVATVNNGKITAVGSGTATVTVKHNSSSITRKITVNIRKDAIIILPGIMGSQIFAAENIVIEGNTIVSGTRLWDPSHGDISEIAKVGSKIRALAMNSQGQPLYQTTVHSPTINERDKTQDGFQYGSLDIYRNIYNRLFDEFFGINCDIVLYEYDWRYDPYDIALELNNFISEQNYGNIEFVSHSMGGIVSSYYLSLGSVQCAKTRKHISVGTPYLGCNEIPDMYCTGAIRDAVYENWILSDAIREIISNIPSIYTLFPFEQYWNPYFSYSDASSETGITACRTYKDTMDCFRNRMPYWNEVLYSKSYNHIKRLFLNNDSHITSMVDSYYVVGDNVQTADSIRGLPENATSPSSTFVNFVQYKTIHGDGTVILYSCTIGNSIDSNRKQVFSGINHIGLIQETASINYIVSIL